MSEEEDPSKFFESLMGDVSVEQWETFKELKRVGEGLICSDGSDVSSESEGEVDISALSIEEKEASVSNTLQNISLNLSSGESSDEESKRRTNTWEPNLTVKYINGEITFDEFADIMEKTNEDEMDDSSNSDVPDSPQKRALLDISAGEKFEEELEEMKKKRKRKRKGHLPKDLQGLMGEANLCFVRGEHEDAVKMCMEVIRLVPRAAEPFQTLGMIYDEMGDMEKAYQFSLIGAYLSPNDSEEWVKLAQMSLERDNISMAVTCYSQALKSDNTNINLFWERSNLYEKLGDKRKAMMGYEAIVRLLPPEQGSQCMQLCREVAKLHHENGNVSASTSILEKTFLKCTEFVTSEDVNMLLELQLGQKKFADAMKCLRRYCGVQFEGLETDVDSTQPEIYKNSTNCIMPEALPIDLQAKLAITLIQLNAVQQADFIVQSLLEESPEDVGDLFLDIAEAYMDVQHYQEAVNIFRKLIVSENYNLAAIWLRYAESLNALDYIKEASEAYQQVVQMAPMHYEARVTLSLLLKKLGKTKDAIVALSQDYNEGNAEGTTIDAKLLLQSCNLLYEQGLWDEYVPAVKLLLSCHCYPATSAAELQIIINSASYRHRIESLKDITGSVDCSTGHPQFINDDISADEMFDFYRKAFRKLLEIKQSEVLEIIAIRATTSKLLMKKYLKEVEFMAILACYHNRNFVDCYTLMKDITVKYMNSNRAWNFLSQIIGKNEDMRHNRYCLRLLMKNPDHKALSLINGHTALTSGSYKNALGEYMYFYNENPNDPLVCLCIGITFIHIASQKFSLKRHSLLVQGCGFLKKYWDIRGDCQEVFYNMGRAMHALGLTTHAVFYYKKALNSPPSVGEREGPFDLSPEISFNLALIYRSSESEDLSRLYLQKYCII